jgi:dGTPase
VPDQTRAECAVLKAVAAHFVMNAQERIDVMAAQREVVRDLVQGYLDDPVTRLDPDLLADWKAADSDATALRVVVDQVASLTDVRALHLHEAWS